MLRSLIALLALGTLLGACTPDNDSSSLERMQRNHRAAMQTAA
jgi:hypothetical protein